MPLEQGKIGNSQLTWLMIGFIIGPAILLVPGSQAKHDAWLAILLGMLEGMLFILISVVLSIKFKGKDLIRINETVYGPYLSKFISLAYIWFLFHAGSLVLVTFKNFFSTTTLPQTPEAVTVILIILAGAYAVKNGIEVISRSGQLLSFTMILPFFVSFLLLIKNIDFRNLLPLLEAPLPKLATAAHSASEFLFADTIAFMMIFPYLNNQKKGRITAPVISAVIFSGLFLTIVSIRNIGVLGPMNEVFLYPTFQADRLINVGNLLTRLEILTVVGFLILGFVKITVLLYTTVLSGAQLLGLRTYHPLILPVGILMALVALINFKNATGNIEFIQQIYPLYALPFQVGIPLLTLIIALIRGLPKY